MIRRLPRRPRRSHRNCQTHQPVPDHGDHGRTSRRRHFLARALADEFALEATTINPSVGSDGQRIVLPEPQTTEETKAYFKHYLPISYAGPLTAKLRKA